MRLEIMGVFSVSLEVADPARRQYETVEALVDSGATYTVLPASTLDRLGVKAHGTRRFVLADGSHVTREFGSTWMRLDGRESISPVVFWDEGARPLLGAVTLEILSLGIDPVNRRLVPVDAFMLETADLDTEARGNSPILDAGHILGYGWQSEFTSLVPRSTA